MIRKSHLRSFAALLCAALCPLAHAVERVTLRNGFPPVDCARHETVGDRVRLYFASNPNSNYMDVPAAQIAQIETMPDPVPEAAPAPPPAAPSIATPATAAATLTDAELEPLLLHASVEHRIDQDLLASIVKAESNGRTTAVSRTGARGLMQLMPGTAADLGVTNTFIPDQNIAGGTAYLDQLLTRYHDDVTLALAAYNAGPAAVDRWHGVPPFAETRAYVRRVILEFNRRKLAAMAVTTIQ